MLYELNDLYDCVLLDCGSLLDPISYILHQLADKKIWLTETTSRGLIYLEHDLSLASTNTNPH